MESALQWEVVGKVAFAIFFRWADRVGTRVGIKTCRV